MWRDSGAVSCPSRSFCLTISSDGNAYYSHDPGEPGESWTYVHIDTDNAVFGDNDYGNRLTSVSCPSISVCVTADADGNVLSTTDPGQNRPWTSVEPFGKHEVGLPAVACVSVSLCALADESEVFISHDPTGSGLHWLRIAIAIPAGLDYTSALTCAVSSFCMLLYANGDVVYGSIS